MRYDRARSSPDRHATHIVSAYLAGAARQPRAAILPGGGSRQEGMLEIEHREAITRRYPSVNATRRPYGFAGHLLHSEAT
jgi:hypothetical protein